MSKRRLADIRFCLLTFLGSRGRTKGQSEQMKPINATGGYPTRNHSWLETGSLHTFLRRKAARNISRLLATPLSGFSCLQIPARVAGVINAARIRAIRL